MREGGDHWYNFPIHFTALQHKRQVLNSTSLDFAHSSQEGLGKLVVELV